MSRPHYGCEYWGARASARPPSNDLPGDAPPVPRRPSPPPRGGRWRERGPGRRGASALGPARGRAGPRRLFPRGGRCGARGLLRARRRSAGATDERGGKVAEGRPLLSRRRAPRLAQDVRRGEGARGRGLPCRLPHRLLRRPRPPYRAERRSGRPRFAASGLRARPRGGAAAERSAGDVGRQVERGGRGRAGLGGGGGDRPRGAGEVPPWQATPRGLGQFWALRTGPEQSGAPSRCSGPAAGRPFAVWSQTWSEPEGRSGYLIAWVCLLKAF